MQIKKLEIIGFKSFCDRTVVHFDEPITGVVGPNGCGKSNIVDAIRWCMGEQSARFLRGKAMEDVIFAGAEKRGAAPMAEVALTFENDGRVPVEYLPHAEITVSRRLFRDGTSEYLLNQVPCRLRDVTDFFLGTGVGTKAYSIIEQGKVGLIVTSKPEDRRALIEEAAGITKYKLKKRAAEKRIESTRQNLLRLSDVLAEIGKQLGSLRRQAQKAERYKQYKAEVRDIELWMATHRWLEFQVQGRVLKASLDEKRQGRTALAAEVETGETDIARARLEMTEEEQRLAALQEQVYQLDNRIKLGEAENEHAERETTSLEERARLAGEELAIIARQLEAGLAEAERLERELALQDEIKVGVAAGLEEREARCAALKEEMGRGHRGLEVARSEMAVTQAAIAAGEANERSVARRAGELDLRLGRIVQEAAQLAKRSDELRPMVEWLETTLKSLREAQGLRGGQREAHQVRLDELKQELDTEERSFNELTAQLQQRRSRHQSLLEIQERYEGFARGTQAIMLRHKEALADTAGDGAGRWGIRGLVADIVEAPPEYEVAVEAALGDRLGSVLVESHEVGVDGIEHLKAKHEGRATFIPLKLRAAATGAVDATHQEDEEGVCGRLLDLVPCKEEYQAVAQELLGDVVVVDDLLRAVDLWRAGERRRLVTLEGEVLDPSGMVTGGSREAQGAGILERRREMRQLEEQLGSLEREHAERSERVSALKSERDERQAALERLEREGHEGEMAVLTHDKDAVRLREELERIGARLAKSGEERAELESERAGVVEEARAIAAKLRADRERLGAVEEQHRDQGAQAVELLERVEAAQAELTEYKVSVAQGQEKRNAIVESRQRVAGQRLELEQRRQRLLDGITSGHERIDLLRRQVAECRSDLVGKAAESRDKAEALRAGRTAYESRLGEMLRAEADLKARRTELQALGEELSRLELDLRERELELGHLEQQIDERWRCRLADVVIDYHLRPPVAEAEEERLGELRDLIERMGEINLTAIEEYRALDERHRFLADHKADLERALAQLEDAIARINRASKKRFREVFDLVNHQFQELFPRLFRGGHARLVLTNEDDILESGIEIIAVPPGKKGGTLELLSGGEKALTAVSLIFAIFLVKPSPFCILDEVDAPLDEANVGRFNDLVRAMTDRSQFIIITHNKRTMEIADTLYGVTMEEPGVSKLVSVNLTAVGRKAA